MPGMRHDGSRPASTDAPEPQVTSVVAGAARYYEPATTEPDRRLATELGALLAGVPGVERAYLARVREGEGAEVLTVCIVARAPVSDDVVRRIGRAFATTHGTAGVLDVQEINAAQDRALAPSVPPFYGSPLPPKETVP